MIITQAQAGKLAGVTRQQIHNLTLKIPLPGFFIEVKKGLKVDTSDPEWLTYLETTKARQAGTEKIKYIPEEELINLINIVDSILKREYGEKEAARIKNMILEEV